MVYALGNIQYRNSRTGDLVDCSQTTVGQLIVDDDLEIVENEIRLNFILVVEKDTIFQVCFYCIR
jgi:DNA topoisomerase VI subunit A